MARNPKSRKKLAPKTVLKLNLRTRGGKMDPPLQSAGISFGVVTVSS
jgi:hypothetical protein